MVGSTDMGVMSPLTAEAICEEYGGFGVSILVNRHILLVLVHDVDHVSQFALIFVQNSEWNLVNTE